MPSVVLTIQHTPVCPPARVGDWLTAAGCVLDIRHPYADGPLPKSLDGFAGLLVLGGEMGADDDDRFPWLGPTKALLSEAVRREVPTLAICLGHQLLAVAEGGTVAPAPAGPQIGLHAVRPSPAAAHDPLFGPLGIGARAAHWNNDLVTTPPPGVVELARTDAGLQAYRLGERVWAVQFHPEVDVDILRAWADADVTAGLISRELVGKRLAAVAAADLELVRTWRRMTDSFAHIVTARSDWLPGRTPV